MGGLSLHWKTQLLSAYVKQHGDSKERPLSQAEMQMNQISPQDMSDVFIAQDNAVFCTIYRQSA